MQLEVLALQSLFTLAVYASVSIKISLSQWVSFTAAEQKHLSNHNHTCICQHIRIAVLFVLQLQKVAEHGAIFFYSCGEVCKLLRTPRVLQEEAERVATLLPVFGAVIAAQSGHRAHGRVCIFGIIQVGSVRRTLLQEEKMIFTIEVKKKPSMHQSLMWSLCIDGSFLFARGSPSAFVLIEPPLSRCVDLRGKVKGHVWITEIQVECTYSTTAPHRPTITGPIWVIYRLSETAAWYKWIPGRSSQLLSHNHTVHTQNGELQAREGTTSKPSGAWLALAHLVPHLSIRIIPRKATDPL